MKAGDDDLDVDETDEWVASSDEKDIWHLHFKPRLSDKIHPGKGNRPQKKNSGSGIHRQEFPSTHSKNSTKSEEVHIPDWSIFLMKKWKHEE